MVVIDTDHLLKRHMTNMEQHAGLILHFKCLLPIMLNIRSMNTTNPLINELCSSVSGSNSVPKSAAMLQIISSVSFVHL